ncbi:hypothetical protein [Bacillus sp. LL01]|uniref:hypothetical protein n=1 Tax=Bacillus sp. LL01 TaxID=1665556 RepID=UPI000AB7C1CE|nr:hypothetical protein [Bacillus sp. LL01]
MQIEKMKSMIRLFIFIFLAVLTVLLITEGFQLWTLGTAVDGKGIGVYFLGMEINDRVPVAKIPSYAFGFFFAGLCTLLLAIIPFAKLLFNSASKTALRIRLLQSSHESRYYRTLLGLSTRWFIRSEVKAAVG